jgi:hypothetical protein
VEKSTSDCGEEERREEKNFKCDFCAKRFSIQKYLDSHITNKHPEKCEINSQVLQVNGRRINKITGGGVNMKKSKKTKGTMPNKREGREQRKGIWA